MPALNEYAFNALVCIAKGAREAFIESKIRPEQDVANYCGRLIAERDSEIAVKKAPAIDIEAVFAGATREKPEALAHLADSYITLLYDFKGRPFNGAMQRAKALHGSADMIDLMTIMAATGTRPADSSGMAKNWNEAAYR